MICPLKFTNGDNPVCDKEHCGFYSCKNHKCAIASLGDIANEIAELKPPRVELTDGQREWIKNHYGYEIE